MRNSARQPADRFHLLRLRQPLMHAFPLGFRLFSFGDITGDDERLAVVFHESRTDLSVESASVVADKHQFCLRVPGRRAFFKRGKQTRIISVDHAVPS